MGGPGALADVAGAPDLLELADVIGDVARRRIVAGVLVLGLGLISWTASGRPGSTQPPPARPVAPVSAPLCADANCGAPGFQCPPGTHCHNGVCVPDHDPQSWWINI